MTYFYTRKPTGQCMAMRPFRRLFLVLILMLAPAGVFAEGEITSSIIEISAGAGYYRFDDDRGIDDTGMATMGIGLQFSRRWLMLLHYSALEYDSDRPKVTLQKYHVDVHRFFNTDRALRPYLVAGFGQLDIDDGVSDTNKNMFNAGVGLSYTIAPTWFVRGDARIFSSTNGDFNDDAFTLTLGYRFGQGER